MKFFNPFRPANKPERDPHVVLRDKLPELHGFVEMTFPGSTRRHSVPVNDVGPDGVVTRAPAGLEPGGVADFLYINPAGRFRFSAACQSIEGNNARFELPETIKTIESYAARRGAPRVSKLMPVQWRYAPDGQGYGEYVNASLVDLSNGGASLVAARALKVGTLVEVRFTLRPNESPFVEVCEVVRSSKIETSDMNSAGIRFIHMDAQDERALMKFLDEVKTTRRDRGVV